jgi:hypothetical protein
MSTRQAESQPVERLKFRRKVDALGFAMVYHILTLDQELSDGAFRLYTLLLKYARQAGGCWPGVERLSKDLDKEPRTVKRRLAELVERGLITRERRYGHSSITWLEDLEQVYAGHPLLSFEEEEQALSEQTSEGDKNVPFEQVCEGDKNVPIDGDKNVPTEEKTEKKKQDVGGGFTDEQKAALEALTALDVETVTARRLAGSSDPARVDGWVTYARRAQGLANPAAFVVARLLAGEVPPTPPANGSRSDGRRFIEGEFAEFIRH